MELLKTFNSLVDDHKGIGRVLLDSINKAFDDYEIPMHAHNYVITSNQSEIKEAKVHFCTSNSLHLTKVKPLFGDKK